MLDFGDVLLKELPELLSSSQSAGGLYSQCKQPVTE